MSKFHGSYRPIYIEIEFVIRTKGFILDIRTSYILASDWFISNEIEWCLGVVTYKKQNATEKYHLYRSVNATDRETFKEKFPAKILSLLLIVS